MEKVTLFITLLMYSIVVSQSFMYILALKHTQLALGGSTYTEVRQLIDANMNVLFRYVMYAALISSLLQMIFCIQAPHQMKFITSSIAFVALLADAILTLKGNVPLNKTINTWTTKDFPADWKRVRQEWFRVFRYRQFVNITGFVSLLLGGVFG